MYLSLRKPLILSGFLPTSVETHQAELGGEPPRELALSLQCQRLAAGQRVVMMHVPRHTHADFQTLVSRALRQALAIAARETRG